MKTFAPKFARLPFISLTLLAAVFTMCFSLPLGAQQSAPNSVAVQQAAMKKLSFLAGRWSGPITVALGPSKTLHLTQTEHVQYRLDGLVMLVEGKSTSADGKTPFQALATIAYDDASHTYHFRAYHAGHYIDTALSVTPRGFSWGFTEGPAHIVNTMHLTAQGEWDEVTETTVGHNPPFRAVDMLLRRTP